MQGRDPERFLRLWGGRRVAGRPRAARVRAVRPVWWPWVLVMSTIAVAARPVHAQCRVPKNSNEAKLLAFFEAPITFSPVAAPTALPPWAVRIEGEVVPIPMPSREILRTGYCSLTKEENPRLTPVFGRPRITIALPAGFAVEGSYIPPITVGDAEPHLASFALSVVRPLPVTVRGGAVSLLLRAHGTVGRVRGPITCPAKSLQTTTPSEPCYGTQPSHDTFYPDMVGGEGALGLTARSGRWSVYAGGGITRLQPRFQVGFTDGTGYRDRTRIEVNLTRGSVFGGVTARLIRALELSAQVYSVPADVTTLRFGAGYRVR